MRSIGKALTSITTRNGGESRSFQNLDDPGKEVGLHPVVSLVHHVLTTIAVR
jgi:hypothetical protein